MLVVIPSLFCPFLKLRVEKTLNPEPWDKCLCKAYK